MYHSWSSLPIREGTVMRTHAPIIALVAAFLAVPACGTSENLDAKGSGAGGLPGAEKSPGSEGGPCYGNGTCNAGLTCLSNLCVDTGTGDSGSVDASVGGSAGVAGSGGTGGTTGTTGGSAGSGGFAGAAGSGTGGATGGTGGTGGATGGTGGATGGTGGATGGTGGATGGTGGSCQPTVAVSMPGGYQIDATEVTGCQYRAWLDTNPSTVGQPSVCTWNDSFEPTCYSHSDRPVACVDWCDAYAYCKWVGKRLCGKIGGGANDYANDANPSTSQWYAACSQGGVYSYPYGNTYDGLACNGMEYWTAGWGYRALDVGSLSTCQSYPGLYDMSGNVSEWEDSCSGNECHARGGSFRGADGTWLTLGCSSDYSGRPRDYKYDNIGFRCCSNP